MFTYLSFSQTLGRTGKFFVTRLQVWMPICAVVLVPLAIFMLTLNGWLSSVIIHEHNDNTWHPHHIGGVGFLLLIQWAVKAVITVVGRGAISRAVALLYLESPDLEFQECLIATFGNLKDLILASIVVKGMVFMVSLIPYGLLIVSILIDSRGLLILAILTGIPALALLIYLHVGLCLSAPSIVVENRNFWQGACKEICSPPGCLWHNKRMRYGVRLTHSNLNFSFLLLLEISGLQRSWELSDGSKIYIGCSLFVLEVAKTIFSMILHAIFATQHPATVKATMWDTLVDIMPMIIFFPLSAMYVVIIVGLCCMLSTHVTTHNVLTVLYSSLETILYLNLRVGRESLNGAVLSSDINATPGSDRPMPELRDAPAVNMMSSDTVTETIDYRHIPLVEDDDFAANASPRQEFV